MKTILKSNPLYVFAEKKASTSPWDPTCGPAEVWVASRKGQLVDI